MTTSAPTTARVHPGFIQTGWAVCLGWLMAAIWLGAAALALSFLGLFDSNAINGPALAGYLRAPYLAGNWWASAADVSVAVLVIAVSSALVQRSIWARTGYLVGTKTVISTLTLTGVAPYFPIDPRIVTGFGALLVATTVFYFCAREDAEQPPLPLRQIGWCTAAALAICASYVSFHPLRFGSFDIGFPTPTSISINNAGLADATLLAVSPAANIQDGGQPRPVTGATIPARGHLWITLKTHGCPPNKLTLRYRLLGGIHNQTISVGGSCSPAPRQ